MVFEDNFSCGRATYPSIKQTHALGPPFKIFQVVFLGSPKSQIGRHGSLISCRRSPKRTALVHAMAKGPMSHPKIKAKLMTFW